MFEHFRKKKSYEDEIDIEFKDPYEDEIEDVDIKAIMSADFENISFGKRLFKEAWSWFKMILIAGVTAIIISYYII